MSFFFQAEDGIRDLVRSRGLGDVYKRQVLNTAGRRAIPRIEELVLRYEELVGGRDGDSLSGCLLYTSDAADDLLCVDLGGRRIIKKNKSQHAPIHRRSTNNINHAHTKHLRCRAHATQD